MGARGWLLSGLAIAAGFLLVGRAVTSLVADLAWFTAMDAPGLFWERVIDSVILQGGAWMLGSVFAFVNLHAVRRTIIAVAVPSRVANIELTAMVSGRRLLWVVLVLSLLVGAVLATPLTNWTDLALVRHGLPFGEIEGILNRDLGFYVYWLPLEETLYLWTLVAVVSITALVVVLYALTRSLRVEGRRITASTHVRRHLTALGSLVLLLLAWSYRLDAFDLLQYGSGPDGLFMRVDHRVTLHVDFVLSIGSALAALLILRAGWMGQLRLAFITLSVVLVAALGLRHAAPALLARGSVLGDPARRDADYVAMRTLVSRRAFEVDGIRIVHADSASGTRLRLNSARVAQRQALWDRAMLGVPATARAPASSIATVATTSPAPGSVSDNVTPGWSIIDGRPHAVRMRRTIDARDAWEPFVVDLTRSELRERRLRLGGVDALSADELDVSDGANEPLVAPGLSGYRLIDASRDPAIGGAPVSSWRARVAHAWALRDPSLLAADTLYDGSTLIVTHRDVRERVQRLAPVFAHGSEIQPLVHNGRLYWTLHLYSASDRYPLSQRWQFSDGIYSYFRLAATAVVSAHTGRVLLVPAHRPDALTRSWMARVPTLFNGGDGARDLLPQALIAQLPPATDKAIAQIRTFARYGSRVEGAILRHLPDSALIGGPPAPHLIGVTDSLALAWSVPLLDVGDQLDGVITATGGMERATWWDPTVAPRQRWSAMAERLTGALDSVRADNAGVPGREPRMRPGRLQVIASDQGTLLFGSLQWSRGDGGISLPLIGVTDGTRVGIGTTLDGAMAALGGSGRTRLRPLTPLPLEPPDALAGRLYEVMRQALARGDWVRFGGAFDSLGRVLRRPPP